MAKLVYTDASGREMSVELGPQAPVVSIGRATDCTIRSNRKSVSRHHAEFHYSNGRYEIVDLNSSNGTYLMINDERKPVSSSEFLQDQDEVWCGDFILRFYQDASQQPGGQKPAAAPQLNGNYGGGGLEVEQGYGANRVTQDFGQEEMGGFGQGGFGQGQNPNQGGAQQGFGQNSYDSGMGAGQHQGGVSGGQNGFGQTPYDAGMGAGQNQGGFGQNGFDQGGFDQGGDEDDGGGVSFGVSAGGGQYAGLNEASAGYDDVLEIDPRELASEVSEVDPYAGGGVSAGGVDVARLQDEKRAIEELAARQADEIEGLRRQLEEAQRAAPQGGDHGEAERLNAELREALQENERLSTELRETREASQEALIERERGEDLDRRLQEATARIDELRARAETAESQLEARGGDVDLLERELERAQEELRAARGGGQAREELEAARKEAARQERLLGEFERRNRDLQAEQVELNAEIEALRAAAVDAGGRLEAAQAELSRQAEELEGLRAERDTLQGRAEAAEGSLEEARAARASLESLERDLRGEIEGLKQRLKLERERARSGEQAAPGFDAGALRAKMESLDRIVDAIERTDLQPLSTVDRVRLQSAIRDTAPRRTLKAMMDALSEG